MADLTYSQDNIWTRFYPETEAGKEAWDAMHNQGSVNATVLNSHAPSVIYQLKKAGFKVSKAKPCKLTMDDILKELETL
jgi:predicted Fe-Mo cluster-binding NifX family protein